MFPPDDSSGLLRRRGSGELSCYCGLQSSSGTTTRLFPTDAHPGPPGRRHQALWGGPRSLFVAGSERGRASLGKVLFEVLGSCQSPVLHLLFLGDPETLGKAPARTGSAEAWLIFTAELSGEIVPEP